MKLLVLGGTGATGRLLLEQALERGHAVTALVRSAGKLALDDPALTVAEGEVLEPGTLADVVPGHDAILSALGQRAGATTIYSEPGRLALEAMRQHGVARFICITAAGLEEDDPAFGVVYRHVLRRMLGSLYADQRRLEALLRENDWAEWTVVRVPQLVDNPLTAGYRVSPRFVPAGAKSPKIGRADVAHFMLGELERREYLRGTPTLAY